MPCVIITVDVPAIKRSLHELASKNYEIGRRFEYRVQNYLRKLGYYVIRSYASKGMLDLIAIPPAAKVGFYNQTLGIQAKANGYVKPTERESLESCKDKWQMTILIAWSEKHKLKFRTLNGQEIAHESLDILGTL